MGFLILPPGLSSSTSLCALTQKTGFLPAAPDGRSSTTFAASVVVTKNVLQVGIWAAT